MQRFPSSFFVTGTDTGIGKTVVSSLLTLGLGATYWKPIQSGTKDETDSQYVQRVSGVSPDRIIAERFKLTEPLSPHASAEIDSVTISLDDFRLPDFNTKHLVVEGAGGLMVPLNDHEMIIDLIQYLELPVLLVCSSMLGTLNHTFLSLEALRYRNIEILGVIMNGPKNQSNLEAIEQFGEIRVLGELEPLTGIDSESLNEAYQKLYINPAGT